MHKRTKIALALGLVLTVLSITYLATPALASANGTPNGDQQRLRTENCDGEMLQIRKRCRLQTENQDCNCEGEGTQMRTRNNYGVEECTCEGSAEQCRMRYRQGV